MAFRMDGEFLLPATREQVWRGLNDAEILRRCITGCQELEKVAENSFIAKVRMQIGPVSALFSGKVDLKNLDPPNGYRIEGQGDGGAAGFAKGVVDVALADAEGGALLRYNVDAEIGGRLAQLGGRLVNGVARQQADQFFTRFAEEFGAVKAAESGAPATAPARAVSQSQPGVVQTSSAPSLFAFAVSLIVAMLAGFMLGRSTEADWWVIVMIGANILVAATAYGLGKHNSQRT